MFATFLIEFDGELQVLRVSPHCCVLKLDRSKVNWFQVDNLSNLSLFIEDETSNVSIISDPMEEESGHLANTILCLVSVKLTSQNYLVWKSQVLPLIQSLDLEHHINDAGTPSSQGNDDRRYFESNHRPSKRKRCLAVHRGADASGNQRARVLVKGSWLKDSLYSLKRGSLKLEDFLKKFKGICNNLTAIGKPLFDEDKVFQLARALGPKYANFKTAMLTKPPYPSMKEFTIALYNHEQTVMVSKEEEGNKHTDPNYAFFGQRGRGKNYKGARGRGHSQNNGGRGNKNNQYSWANNNQTQPTYGQRSQKPPQQPSQMPKTDEIKQKQKEMPCTISCQICGKNNHSSTVCHHRYDYYRPKDEVPQALAAINIEDPTDQQFYTDSGATAYMTNTTGNLVQYSPYVGYDEIYNKENQVLAKGRRKGNFYALEEVHAAALSAIKGNSEEKIKIFQSDGGGEFSSIAFISHLEKCGIIRQVSCPYTPEQNGIAKRKHRHIVETALTMMYHASLPMHLWVEAFLTAIYLINKMPLSTLGMKSPYQTLLKKLPDYNGLKVFRLQEIEREQKSQQDVVYNDDIEVHPKSPIVHEEVSNNILVSHEHSATDRDVTQIPPEHVRNHEDIIFEIINSLSSQFALKDLGDLSYFLGIEVKKFTKGLFLSQSKYTKDILARVDMQDCTSIRTPIATSSTAFIDDDEPVDATEYRGLVGSLQYLTFTRRDITHVGNRACQHFQAPNKAHMRAVKRILRYLKGTIHYSLQFLSQSSLTLNGFSYSDWAGCSVTRQSTIGYSIYLGANLDIGLPMTRTPLLLGDNMSALHLTKNSLFHARTKHIEIGYHFVREKVAQGSLDIKHVPSHQQMADVFTKPLSKQPFLTLRHKLGVHCIDLPSLKGADKNEANMVIAYLTKIISTMLSQQHHQRKSNTDFQSIKDSLLDCT
ncbi:hypothetical protein WN944_007476 [Citrus x changshan-huyou]|uniref:Integrase catalytic domain-containing protein n=1 Tax=Citrus x changshan-huyou TaxID=2935761 RepID=A0AAP0ML37_9ROSI